MATELTGPGRVIPTLTTRILYRTMRFSFIAIALWLIPGQPAEAVDPDPCWCNIDKNESAYYVQSAFRIVVIPPTPDCTNGAQSVRLNGTDCPQIVGGEFDCATDDTEGHHNLGISCTSQTGGSFARTISMDVDRTKPVIFVQPQPPGTIYASTQSAIISGSVESLAPINQMAVTYSTGSSLATQLLHVDGSVWEFHLDIRSLNIPHDASRDVTLYFTASDLAGNTWSILDPGVATATISIDGTPPTVSVSSPTGSVRSFTAIRGTAFDANGIVELQIGIKNIATGKYWSGSGLSSAPVFMPVENVPSEPGIVAWTFPIQSSTFPAGQPFAIYGRATDPVGNQSNGDSPLATFIIPAGPIFITTGNSTNVANLITFTLSSRNISYGRSMDLCAEIDSNVDADLRGSAPGQVTFETQTGAIKPFRNNPGQDDSQRLPGSCGQGGIPLRIFSDAGNCLPNDRVTAKLFGAVAGTVDITILIPTETNSVVGAGGIDHLNRITTPDPGHCKGGDFCAIDIYDMAVWRAGTNLDMQDQSYHENVLAPHQLVIGGQPLPFCRSDHSNVTAQNPNIQIFPDNTGVMSSDKVGIAASQTNAEHALVGLDALRLVMRTMRPFKCGAETFQEWRFNKCRIPVNPTQFVRQRTQIIVQPNLNGPIPTTTFSTSKSDEHNPHGSLDSP